MSPSPKALLASLLAAAPVVLAGVCQPTNPKPIVDHSECDCYVIDSTPKTYYAKHGFWDFRSLSEFAGVPDLVDDMDAAEAAPFSSEYFEWDKSEFTEFWGPQKWSKQGNDYPMQNSYSNLYIEENEDSASDTFLTMRTARFEDFQSASEFNSMEKHLFASMRMYSRTIGSSGACTALFTYENDTQEADIEVLTKDPENIIHYTNQPGIDSESNVIEGAHEELTLPDGVKWTDWVAHRMDWTPHTTIWHVNGKKVHENSFQVPEVASSLIFNAWSDGGSWTGEMEVGGIAYQQIQWIEILYGEVDGSECKRKCSVDESPELGKPVRV